MITFQPQVMTNMLDDFSAVTRSCFDIMMSISALHSLPIKQRL